MTPEEISMVYLTIGGEGEAQKMAQTLIQESRAACVNILGKIQSHYKWKGKLQTEEEVAVLIKCPTKLVDQLVTRIKELHSYDCPCVVSWTLNGGSPEFLNWIGQQITND